MSFASEHPLITFKFLLRSIRDELPPWRLIHPHYCAKCGRKRTVHPAIHCSLCSFMGHFER